MHKTYSFEEVAYSWVTGDFANGCFIKGAAVALEPTDIKTVCITSLIGGTEQSGSVLIKDFARNALFHHNDVRSRDNIYAVACREDLCCVDGRKKRKE